MKHPSNMDSFGAALAGRPDAATANPEQQTHEPADCKKSRRVRNIA
jgi:hypothetical protein